MAQSQIRAEFGAWVESTQRKVNGKGFRKVWVSPAPTGEPRKLAVIRTGERGDAHMLTLDVSAEDRANDALEALSLALDALGTLAQFGAPEAPKPAPASKPARKPTQAPPAAPVSASVAANRAIAEAIAPKSLTDAGRDPKQAAVARTAAVAKARANKPAPTPRVQNPAPVRDQGADMLDWLDAIRA